MEKIQVQDRCETAVTMQYMKKNEEINSAQQLISSNIQRVGFTIYYYLHDKE